MSYFIGITVTQENKGRGYKLAQLFDHLSSSALNSQTETVSPLQKLAKTLEKTYDVGITSKNVEQKISGRGKIIANILSEAKQGQNLSVLGVSNLGQTKGRGHFLEQIANQSDLKESLGWKKIENNEKLLLKTPEGLLNSSLIATEISKNLTDLSLSNEDVNTNNRGESGEVQEFMTNYLPLKVDPDKKVYEYFVKFEPEVDFVAIRLKLINQCFRTRRGINCFDGGTKLFLPDKITEEKLVVEAKHPNDESPVLISVELKKKMSLKECEQLYNVLFNNCAKVLKFARLGRENYDFKQSHQIPQHKLEIWPGYITSIKEFDGGLLLCCDVKHRVLRLETAYEVLSNIARYDSNNFQVLAARELLGQCVLTRYNNNLYRIDDIDWKQTPLSKFRLSSGKEITFLEYYKKQYNLDIKDHKQPLLLSKQKASNKKGLSQLICLVPEICHMTGLTDKMRKDMRVMKEISSYTRVTPAQRHYGFKKFLENLRANTCAQEMLKEWGLTLADEPLEVKGRVLPPENIYFKNNSKIVSLNASWGNQIKNYGLIRTVDLKRWILLHTMKDTNLANRFKEAMKKVGIGLGLDIAEPVLVPLVNDKIESYVEGLKKNIFSETQLVVCLCPTARTDRYSAIKKLCCRERPVPSQVINCGTIMRDNRLSSVVQNVVLQINNKLGGAAWSVHIPLKNCMICGIDTYHEVGSRSVGAFVASLNEDFTKWFSRACIQEPQQELLDGLLCCFTAGLKKYLILNDSLPERIVIFRDGVGEGMFSHVRDHEVKQFLEACRLMGMNYAPKILFVLVTKRINTKFYQITGDTGELTNVKNGGILDHTVTKRNCYDFFLVSQHVSCGTAMPSHYIVLYDSGKLKPDHVQRLAYKLCHLYYNWAGTVRVPAPCLYAHKLAYLVGQNLKSPANSILEDKLYYL